MKILALESSAKAASAAICVDGELTAQYFQNSGLTHSRTLLNMTENMLRDLDMTMQDIDIVAVAKGPGSFTGIRIGAAAAKGLAWAADKKICGVSTLEAMAHHLEWCDGVICPVMDARRGQIYNAKFIMENGKLIRSCPDRAIAVDELIEEAKNDEKTYFLVGDGAQMCYNIMSEAGVNVKLTPAPLTFQSAWGVAKAAEDCVPIAPDDLTPEYLRLSQAERERLARESAKD